MKCDFWTKWLSSVTPIQVGSSSFLTTLWLGSSAPWPKNPMAPVLAMLQGPYWCSRASHVWWSLHFVSSWFLNTQPRVMVWWTGLESGRHLWFTAVRGNKRGEVHAFWFVHQILGAVLQENDLTVCGVCQEQLPSSAVFLQEKSSGSQQGDKIVRITHDKSLCCPHSFFAILTR